MISLIIFLSIKTELSRARACPIHVAQGDGVRGPDVHHRQGSWVMDGSAAGQQVEDNWKIMTSVYIVFIQIQEHCHNVVTTVRDEE